jgi:hypothetical protein
LSDPAYPDIEPLNIMALEAVLVPVAGDVVIPEVRWLLGGMLRNGLGLHGTSLAAM